MRPPVSLVMTNTLALVFIFVFLWSVDSFARTEVDVITQVTAPIVSVSEAVKRWFGYNGQD